MEIVSTLKYEVPMVNVEIKSEDEVDKLFLEEIIEPALEPGTDPTQKTKLLSDNFLKEISKLSKIYFDTKPSNDYVKNGKGESLTFESEYKDEGEIKYIKVPILDEDESKYLNTKNELDKFLKKYGKIFPPHVETVYDAMLEIARYDCILYLLKYANVPETDWTKNDRVKKRIAFETLLPLVPDEKLHEEIRNSIHKETNITFNVTRKVITNFVESALNNLTYTVKASFNEGKFSGYAMTARPANTFDFLVLLETENIKKHQLKPCQVCGKLTDKPSEICSLKCRQQRKRDLEQPFAEGEKRIFRYKYQQGYITGEQYQMILERAKELKKCRDNGEEMTTYTIMQELENVLRK